MPKEIVIHPTTPPPPKGINPEPGEATQIVESSPEQNTETGK